MPDSDPPPELDYEMWLGPAPSRPYNLNRVHYLFRFFWDYAGGQMTNWGAHHLDIAQWGLGMDDSGPVEIQATAEFNQEKLYETPQSFEVTYKYAGGTMIHCASGGSKYKGGTTFEGEQGLIHVTRGTVESTPAEILTQPLDEKAVRLYASTNHHKNWLDCIKAARTRSATSKSDIALQQSAISATSPSAPARKSSGTRRNRKLWVMPNSPNTSAGLIGLRGGCPALRFGD